MGKEWSGKLSQLFASASSRTLELSVSREKTETLKTATETTCGLKVSHPRCVVKIQVREEYPILYSHKTQLNIKLSLLLYYNNMFRHNLSAIFRLYMKPI